jgi:hypothetical protein
MARSCSNLLSSTLCCASASRITYESAENRNKENDVNFMQHLKYIADLKKQAHSFTPESFFRYMDGLIVENMKTFMH